MSRPVGQLPTVLLPDEVPLLQRQEWKRRVRIVAARDLDVPRTGRLVRASSLDQLDELTERRLHANIGELERDVETLANQCRHADREHGVTAESQETGVVDDIRRLQIEQLRPDLGEHVPDVLRAGAAGTLSTWAIICRVSPRES